jgi:cysteine-rich repeat protein
VEFCGSGVVDPGEDCDDGNLTNGDGCDANCTVTSCGNAIVTTGEDCDDGNLDNGDCCDDGCSYESAGSPCMGGAGSCTAAGVCELPPVCGDGVVGTGEECDDGNLLDGDCCSAACTLPTGCATGARAVLVVKDRSNPAADAIVWKLAKGDELAHGLLGDPTATTSYTLCVFDERSAGTSLAAALTVGPDAATWIDKNPNGYVYKDRDGTADGVRKVKIKPGVAGKSKVLIKAKGAAVPLPAAAGPDRIFDQNPRVRVFVVADDVTTCWSTDFPVSSTKKNRVSSFKAVR